MPGCPIFSFFPRYKAYTQINTMMWDMRDHPTQGPTSSHPRFPPPNSKNRSEMRQPAYPAPFIPLGLPPAIPSRGSSHKTHMSYHTFPRSAVPPQVTPGPSPFRSASGMQAAVPNQRSIPARTSSSHQPSRHHPNRLSRHHSHSVSAATPRHVHYADEISQPRSRKVSAQSSHAPSQAQAPLVTSIPRRVQPAVSQKQIQGHRRRAHSIANATAPVSVNFVPLQSQQGVPATKGHEYSRCTGRKKALCIGVNYIGQKRELRGCINDAKNVHRFLTRQWGFKAGDVVVLIDQTTNPRQMPTRQNMIDAMKWLVKDAKPHDSLFFHYSGHGGQIHDTHGDKTDGFDEVIYPVDYKTAGVIIDDELHQLMVKPLPRGCRLTAVFDSCHSGTTLDLPFMYHHDGRLKENHIAASSRGNRMSPADVISFAACRDDQTSADTVLGGVAVGAMSYAFLTALTQKPVQSYLELLLSIRDIVSPHFQQKAQLSSGHYIDTGLRFIL